MRQIYELYARKAAYDVRFASLHNGKHVSNFQNFMLRSVERTESSPPPLLLESSFHLIMHSTYTAVVNP
jgi:hypothetical protein